MRKLLLCLIVSLLLSKAVLSQQKNCFARFWKKQINLQNLSSLKFLGANY